MRPREERNVEVIISLLSVLRPPSSQFSPRARPRRERPARSQEQEQLLLEVAVLLNEETAFARRLPTAQLYSVYRESRRGLNPEPQNDRH